jgi:threonyl-tRNA synthetase
MISPAEIRKRAEGYIPRGYDPALYRLRHSAAHVMAEAVVDLFGKETQIAIGPPTDDGFYYDFLTPRPIVADDLPKIEARMREIIRGGFAFDCRAVSADEARALFAGQPFKRELIDNLAASDGDNIITVYTQDTFPTCAGGRTSRRHPT